MKHLLTLISCSLALSLSAQELVVDYPYNPDYENDGNVGVEDLLQLLAYFDMGFEVDDIVIDEVTLTQWLQTISQTLINQQATIDSLQGLTSTLDSTMVADMISSYGGGMAFGEFEDITSLINDNITSEGPFPVFQQYEDGFLYILLNPQNNWWFRLGVDSVSPLGYDFMNMMSSNKAYYTDPYGITPIIFPINTDEYWSFSAHPFVSVWKAFWIPLESGGGSSIGNTGTMSVSTFGDTLTINGESVIVPGVSYLNVVPEFGSVTDASGNAYSTVDYGPAGEWMTENLKTENFANGDQIPMITSSYSSSNHPASWAWIDNNYLNEAVYGKSYNGTAMTDSRNVCPSGWHIPSENEWIQLILLFGGETGTNGCNNCVGGDNLKSDIFWNGNNQSYMSIVPGGIVNTDGSGGYDGSSGYYWVNDYVGGNGGYAMHFKSDNEITKSSWMYYTFLTVRCIKD